MFRREGDFFLLGTAMAAQLLQTKARIPGFRAPPGAPCISRSERKSERRSEQETALRFKQRPGQSANASGPALQFPKYGKGALRNVFIGRRFERHTGRTGIGVDREREFLAERCSEIVNGAVDL